MFDKKIYLKGSVNSGAIYGLAFIGALVYYLGQAGNLTEGVIGFLKALVWPAFLAYELFNFLGA